MLSEFCPDICPWADIAVALRCLRMGKNDVITYKYVIKDVYTHYYYIVLICVFTFLVPRCIVRSDFCIQTMFGSSLPPVVCRRAHVLFTSFVFA